MTTRYEPIPLSPEPESGTVRTTPPKCKIDGRTLHPDKPYTYLFAVAVAIASRAIGMRKVRTALGTVVANSDAEQSDGKCNRKKPPGKLPVAIYELPVK